MKVGLSMKYIFSPWRMKYIMKPKDRKSGCVFCNAINIEDGPENLVIHRGKQAYIILNQFPYTSGHAMVVPFVHQPSYEDLDPSITYEIFDLIRQITRVLRQVYHPEGFNMGVNIGAASGAGIAPHVNFLIVPRWNGDTNFTTTLADTRILPESLSETYSRLKTEWDKLFPG